MMTSQLTMRQVKLVQQNQSPFDAAIAHYAKESRIDFWTDFLDYLKNGVVASGPNIFLMAKVIDLSKSNSETPELAWFVRYGNGDLSQLAAALPAYLPKIVFYRRKDARPRVYSFDRFLKLSERKKR